MGADDDRRAVVDVVERLDGLDAEVLEVADDALVVDDLAEGVRRLAGGRRLLGLVDRLANAVAEAGALRDADLLDGSHALDYRTGSRFRPSRTTAPLAGRQERGDAAHDEVGGEALGGLAVRAGRQLVGEPERRADADRDAAARMRQLLAARPAPGSSPRSPIGHDRRAGAQGEHGDAVAGLLERAVGAARALREHEQDVALVEDPLGEPERLDVGARRGRPGGRRRCAAAQPTTGQSNSSFLPSQWIRRPSAGVSHGARGRPRRSSRRGWRR